MCSAFHLPKANITHEVHISCEANIMFRAAEHIVQKSAFCPKTKDAFLLVEAWGVEPQSENPSAGFSPSAVGVLGFPSRGAIRQAPRYGSFIKSGLRQSLRRFVPYPNDARFRSGKFPRADA